jgi:diguanylate cyclase (GGDEF)-like protein
MIRIRKSIRLKVIVMFLLVGVLPMAGTSLYLYQNSQEALENEAFNILGRLVDQTNRAVEDTFQEASQILLLTSHNPAFVRYFNEPDKRQEWLKEIQKELGEIQGLFRGSFREACLIREDGKELSKVVHAQILPTHDLDPDESDQTFFKSGLAGKRGDVYQGEPYFSEDAREWVIPFATPIVLPEDKKVALLHLELSLSYLKDILSERQRGWIGIGDLFIVDHRGRFLTHNDPRIQTLGKLNLPNALDANSSPGWRRIIQEMVDGKIRFQKEVIKNRLSYVHYQPTFTSETSNMVWSTGAVVPVDTIQASANLSDYLMVGAIGSLIVLILALWFGSGITRPTLSLIKATSSMARGNLTARVNLRTEDEIGQLGQAFNQMAQSLEASYQAIAKKSSQFQALHDAASALNAVTSHKIIMKLLLDIARKVTDARYGAIAVFDQDGKVTQFFHAGLTPEQEALLTAPPQGQGLLGALQHEGRPIRLEDLSRDPRSSGFPPNHPPMKTFLGVPLRVRGKNLGNLYLTEKANGQPFTEEDEALIVMIARDATMALENARLYEETRRLANTDSLTGLYNRRHFEERLKEELARAQRYNRPFSLVMLDLNHLKQINDHHGHIMGDQAIKTLGEVLLRNIRTNDVAARYGGDEFLALLPETDQKGAHQMTKRLKEQFSLRVLRLENGTSLPLSVGIGTATYPQDALDIENLIKAADRALYREKTSHRAN